MYPGRTIRKRTDTMANKIQLVYVISDGLFLLMGVFILAFSIIVNNVKDEVPTNGRQAARNLLYQGFPLTGWYSRMLWLVGRWEEYVSLTLTQRASSTPSLSLSPSSSHYPAWRRLPASGSSSRATWPSSAPCSP